MRADLQLLAVAPPGTRVFVAGRAGVRKSMYHGASASDGQSTLELVCTPLEVYAVIDGACRAGPEYDTELLASCAIVGP